DFWSIVICCTISCTRLLAIGRRRRERCADEDHMGRSEVANELREQILSGIHVGRFRGGERLPSVRSLSKGFGVNDRVVMAALREVANDGFVELRQRSGGFRAQAHTAG